MSQTGNRAKRPETGLPAPHGPLRRDYLDRLADLQAALRPETYLEIGVFEGASLRLVGPGTRAIGVDPMPEYAPAPGEGQVQVIAQTSDAFFAREDLGTLLGGRPLDLTFIDGAHLFPNVLRDFLNVCRHARPSSLVVFHDTLPVDRLMAAVPRVTQGWTGDVWKILPCLRAHFPGLRLVTIDTAPSGLTLATNLPTPDQVADLDPEALAATFADLDFGWFEAQGRDHANLLPDGPEAVPAALSALALSPANSASAPSM